MMGSKHPALLGASGEEAWAEIWDVISPMLERARRGNATWSEDQLLAINREGFSGGGVLRLYMPDHGRGPPGRRRLLRGARDDRARSLRAATRHSAGAEEQVAEAKTPDAAAVASVATLVTDQEDVPFAALYLERGRTETGAPPSPVWTKLWRHHGRGARMPWGMGEGDARLAVSARRASSARTSSYPVAHGPSPRRAPSWCPSPSWAKTYPMGRSSPESARVWPSTTPMPRSSNSPHQHTASAIRQCRGLRGGAPSRRGAGGD